MPELPDVEVQRRYLQSTALHKRIADAAVRDDNLLDGTSGTEIREALTGASLEETRRHGKHLFVRLSTDRWLALHFGMTGRLRYYKRNGAASDYEYFQIDFENGYRLALVIPRKLGRVRVIDDPDRFIENNDLGPDALGLELDVLRSRLEGRRGMIKSAMMDQSVVAGLGNVYTDEVLFQAGIHPKTAVNDLDDDALTELHASLESVLDTAINCKADPEKMPADRFLLPHRDGDQKDPITGTKLEKISVSGRSGYYSPARQAEPG